MRQFFALSELTVGNRYVFDDKQAHHIRDVLRMKEGDIVRIVSNNNAFLASLQFNGDEVSAEIKKKAEGKPEREIVMAAAMIKKDKWELLIQKACELGASKIVPLETRRTIIHLEDKEINKKLERWNKIALEACQQSNRDSICEVLAPVKLKQIVDYKKGINFVAYESEDKVLLRDLVSDDGSICFVIGPEGGFEKEEVEILQSLGFSSVSLGSRILRAETAGMFVLSVIEALR